MARQEIDLKPVEFITIGTIGPRGQRVFHLQAGYEGRLVSFIIEKEQAWALSEAIGEFIDDLDERLNDETRLEMAAMDMDLREPINPMFRIAQMGLAYDDDDEQIILIAEELVSGEGEDASVVRMWASREQMRALSQIAMDTVEAGRPSPKQNGRIMYYWT